MTQKFYVENAAYVKRFFSTPVASPDAVSREVLRGPLNNFVGEPTVTLLHREVFRTQGLFNQQLIMSCDSEYWHRVGSRFGITHVPEVLALFRVHGQSASADNFERRQFRMRFLDLFVVLHELAYNPSYAALREVAEKCYGPDHLIRECRQRAWESREALRKSASETADHAGVSHAEWQGVAQVYPRLKSLAAWQQLLNWVGSVRLVCSPRGLVARVRRKLL